MLRKLVPTMALALSASLAAAKGMDDLKPTSEEATEADAGADQATKGEDKAASSKAPAKPAVGTASTTQEKEKQVAPSETSRYLADRLSLGSSIGFVRITQAKEGEYRAQGMADFYTMWNFTPKQNFKLLASFRYAPIQSENEVSGQSYKSTIDGYHAGVVGKYGILSKSLELMASLELGYLFVYQDSLDELPVQEDSESNEFATTIGTGFDWVLMEKINVGPRLYAGFGNFTIVQFTAAVTFIL